MRPARLLCRRRLLLALVVLAGLTASAGATSLHADPLAGFADDGWRRTAHGWEHITSWEQPVGRLPILPRQPPLHPLYLAVLQGASSCVALAAAARYNADHRSKRR